MHATRTQIRTFKSTLSIVSEKLTWWNRHALQGGVAVAVWRWCPKGKGDRKEEGGKSGSGGSKSGTIASSTISGAFCIATRTKMKSASGAWPARWRKRPQPRYRYSISVSCPLGDALSLPVTVHPVPWVPVTLLSSHMKLSFFWQFRTFLGDNWNWRYWLKIKHAKLKKQSFKGI